ncbi:MAG: glycosyltransferase family 1 protein [Bacteroidota bacterium]
MRILFDHQIFSLQKFGGISRYFVELAKELRSDPACIVEISARVTASPYLVSSKLSNARTLGVWNFRGKARLFKMLNKPATIRLLHQGLFDIFHPTYYDEYFLPFIGSKPFVLTVYDMIHERFSADAGAGDPLVQSKRLLATKAAAVIAISQSTKDDLVRYHGIDPAKVHVVHLGYTPRPPHELSIELPERYLLFVGKREGYKNFEGFLRAVAPLLSEDKSLYIVCAGGGPFTSVEEEIIRECGVTGRVQRRPVSDDELAECYRRAVVFVFPSHYEGFGLPVLEAFAAGCPVVASKGGSLPEVAGRAARYFSPDDAGDMQRAVGRVLSNASLRRELAREGYRRLKKFSWNKMASETKSVYKRILQRTSRGR